MRWKIAVPGFVPAAELPRGMNPDKSCVSNSNNRIVNDNYPYLITRTWGAPYRAQRIEEILKQ